MPVEPITHLEKSIAGTVEPVTHLEKAIAGTVEPVTHLEKVIDQYGGGGEAVLIQKTITANGTFAAADDNADGYSSVTVDVQGGEKTLTKLADISIQEPVSTVAITATDGMKSCDRLYIKLQNVTLSAEDWVYPYINGTPGSIGGSQSQMGYLDKAQTYAVLLELIRFGGEVHGSVIETAYQFGPNRLVTGANTRLADSLTEINFRLYTAATTFTGGTIEVWGYV